MQDKSSAITADTSWQKHMLQIQLSRKV